MVQHFLIVHDFLRAIRKVPRSKIIFGNLRPSVGNLVLDHRFGV